MTAAPHTLPDPDPFPEAAAYRRMARAIRYIEAAAPDRPPLADVAAAAGLSPAHFQRAFTRWAGISPARFAQALARVRARVALAQGATVLDAALDAGLSGPGRLHDLMIRWEAMTPGEVRRRGAGVEMRWGLHDSPYGVALAVMSPRGLAGLAFADDEAQARGPALNDMRARWPAARFVEDAAVSAPAIAAIFRRGGGEVRLALWGTPWQVQVWEALLRIPEAVTVSYSGIARDVCSARATRAVGTAVGRNPLSLVIPCHRVLRATGALGGYHWGLERKSAMLAREAARGGESGATYQVRPEATDQA